MSQNRCFSLRNEFFCLCAKWGGVGVLHGGCIGVSLNTFSFTYHLGTFDSMLFSFKNETHRKKSLKIKHFVQPQTNQPYPGFPLHAPAPQRLRSELGPSRSPKTIRKTQFHPNLRQDQGSG